MREVIESARTVEQAIEQACLKLGVDRDAVDFEIISLPKKGMLGMFGNALAKVRVFIPESEEKASPAPTKKESFERNQGKTYNEQKRDPRPEQKKFRPENRGPIREETVRPKRERTMATPGSPATLAKIETAKDYLAGILPLMGITNLSMSVEEREDGVTILLDGEGLSAVIGRRGETLDAIQYLVGLVANKGDEEYYRITVDCHNYRAKRAKTLEELAKRMAQKTLKTGRNSFLEPMNPYERRIIHAAVAEIEGASSYSIGEEPGRRVVISLKNRPPRMDRPERSERNDRNDRRDRDHNRGNHSGPKPYGGNRDFRGPKPQPISRDKQAQGTSDAADLPLYGRIDLD